MDAGHKTLQEIVTVRHQKTALSALITWLGAHSRQHFQVLSEDLMLKFSALGH